MKMRTFAILALLVVTSIISAADVPIDWDRARALHQRASRGEKLSPEDEKYYVEAKKQFDARQESRPQTTDDGFDWKRAMEVHQRKERGEKLSEEDEKLLAEAMKRRGRSQGDNSERRSEAPRDFKPSDAAKGLVPLTELTGKYREWDGGLYGGGSNEVPAPLQSKASKAIEGIQPLDAVGKPAADGRIVLMSIGMSNTTREFSTFVNLIQSDERKAAKVQVVDGAQGGKAARQWTEPGPWEVADERLKRAGVTPRQVQVLWIKQANIAPSQTSEEAVTLLQDDLQTIVTLAQQRYPNARIAFLSSRIYAGYAQSRLNPEPYAYEGAFAVRGLIQKQMKADPALIEGKAPVLLWGPYLWAAGPTPLKANGLDWKPEEFAGDGTHPSESGAQKVAQQLVNFFLSDANAKPWFSRK